jgi:hypothetical protein
MARTQSSRGGGGRTGSGSSSTSGTRSKKSNNGSFLGTLKDRPYAAAGVAAGVAGVAAASAFLWSKRSQIGEAIDSGMEKLEQLKAERWDGEEKRGQSAIAEEALTLKETGRKSKGARGPVAQPDIKAEIAESNQEAKAGAKAYS